jgi:UDP-N-acetylmuramyl pentapeptide synthase
MVAIDKETWLKGSRNTGIYSGWTDGHTVLPGLVKDKKISCAIVQRPVVEVSGQIPQLAVPNSYNVFRIMALRARASLTGKIVAITGTVGKSTTKEMLAHLLRNEEDIIATKGNHNTRTGVTMTLAKCIGNPKVCVMEVAVSALWMKSGGVCTYVKPHLCVITEIGLGQVKIARSTHNTAKYKARICNGIEPGGRCLIYGGIKEELEYVCDEVRRYGAIPLLYGNDSAFDSHIIELSRKDGGTHINANILGEAVEYSLPLIGQVMAVNSVAALSVLKLLGYDIQTAAKNLADFNGNSATLELVKYKTSRGEITVIDDSHNAQILSMIAGFDTLKDEAAFGGAKRKIAVLGRVVNLGDKSAELHESLADPLMNAGVDRVFAYGEEMRPLLNKLPEELIGGGVLFSDTKSCVNAVLDYAEDGDYILIKGSRRAGDFGKVSSLLRNALKSLEKKESALSEEASPV